MSNLLPPPEPTDPAEWLIHAEKRVQHFTAIGGHYGKVMAENWRQEIENAQTLPRYFNKTRFES
jgi:hypothetical protein